MGNFFWQELKADEAFDPLTINPVAPFTQADFFGRWQKALGRPVRRFVVKKGEEQVAYGQIITYKLTGNKNYCYLPYGPILKNYDPDLLKFLRHNLKKIAGEEKAVFIRLDFTPPPNQNEKKLLAKIFSPTWLASTWGAIFQPRTDWALNLAKSDEELLREMKKDARYSIHAALRRGAAAEIVRNNFPSQFEIFYDLLKITERRDKFSLHPKSYYQTVVGELHRALPSFFVVVKGRDKILVINLVIVYGAEAYHIFGGSSDENRDLFPSYLATWAGIIEAKRLGCQTYNFGGVTEGQGSRWAGVAFFKQKFGGELKEHSPLYDLIVNPFWYLLYNLRKTVKFW